jgi:hypothetical protein
MFPRNYDLGCLKTESYNAETCRFLCVMYGRKQLINFWLAFMILELEMNFDNFILEGVTCILRWHSGNFKFTV